MFKKGKSNWITKMSSEGSSIIITCIADRLKASIKHVNLREETIMRNLFRIDSEITIIDKVICRHINNLGSAERGIVSQDILAQLRNFIEHIMLKVYANGQDIDITYNNIQDAINYVKTRGNLKFLRRFHDFLEIVASHYTLDEENSERLMLKYYEYLLKTKKFLKTQYSLDVLGNLDIFPLNTDPTLNKYYEKIAEIIDRHNVSDSRKAHNDRY